MEKSQMAALAAVVATDGETNPVSHTFTPLGPDQDGVQWFEQTSPAPANALAAKRFSVQIKRAIPGKQQNGIARLTLRMWYPVMETLSTSDSGITPPPTIAYQLYAEARYVVPERSTEQERKNLRTLLVSFGGQTIISDVLQKLQPMY